MRYYNHSLIYLATPVSFFWLPCGTGISSAFACIRYHSFLFFFEYVPFPVALFNVGVVAVVTLVPSAEVFEASNKLYMEMGRGSNIGNFKVVRRQLRSLQPFGVQLGVLQGIRKFFLLTTFSLISDNIFNLLVTFPQDVVTN